MLFKKLISSRDLANRIIAQNGRQAVEFTALFEEITYQEAKDFFLQNEPRVFASHKYSAEEIINIKYLRTNILEIIEKSNLPNAVTTKQILNSIMKLHKKYLFDFVEILYLFDTLNQKINQFKKITFQIIDPQTVPESKVNFTITDKYNDIFYLELNIVLNYLNNKKNPTANVFSKTPIIVNEEPVWQNIAEAYYLKNNGYRASILFSNNLDEPATITPLGNYPPN